MANAERVYAVYDYFDGPRAGVADFQGRPHFFECVFDETKDEYSDDFDLSAIDVNLMPQVLERWEIWLRWRKAFDEGKVTLETHPALPEDRARDDELKKTLEPHLRTAPDRAIRAHGEFIRSGAGYEVVWSMSGSQQN